MASPDDAGGEIVITTLGSCGGYATADEACIGMAIRTATSMLLVDAGAGTLQNLLRRVELNALDAVVISHEHPDHWLDLEQLAVACDMGGLRDERLQVFAPVGLIDVMYRRTPIFEWHDLVDGMRATVGRTSLEWTVTDHEVPTFALRCESEGTSVGFTADTGTDWTPESLGAGLDLLISEATFPEREASSARDGQHLTASQAGLGARRAGARSLAITHMFPRFDRRALCLEAADAFGSAVIEAAARSDILVARGRTTEAQMPRRNVSHTAQR